MRRFLPFVASLLLVPVGSALGESRSAVYLTPVCLAYQDHEVSIHAEPRRECVRYVVEVEHKDRHGAVEGTFRVPAGAGAPDATGYLVIKDGDVEVASVPVRVREDRDGAVFEFTLSPKFAASSEFRFSAERLGDDEGRERTRYVSYHVCLKDFPPRKAD